MTNLSLCSSISAAPPPPVLLSSALHVSCLGIIATVALAVTVSVVDATGEETAKAKADALVWVSEGGRLGRRKETSRKNSISIRQMRYLCDDVAATVERGSQPKQRSRVVKDHIFFYLDQRSRSLPQRSRSLHTRSSSLRQRSRSPLKDQDHLQWSRSILRSRSLFDQNFSIRQHITQVRFAHFDQRCNSKVQ